ncbi:MAG: hypothetical protein M0Z38_06685 [Deltaproteobacteria bacterium]|nr:hypothetical protein [Deltaproteobacteria bacterium]
MMRKWWIPLLCLLAMSCGSSSGPPAPVEKTMLTWIQDAKWNDNSPMDLRLISWYEVHVSDNAAWNDNTLRAALAGVDNVGVPVSTFDLSLLAAYGIRPNCYVTVRSISIDNAASDYGTPCWWEAP